MHNALEQPCNAPVAVPRNPDDPSFPCYCFTPPATVHSLLSGPDLQGCPSFLRRLPKCLDGICQLLGALWHNHCICTAAETAVDVHILLRARSTDINLKGAAIGGFVVTTVCAGRWLGMGCSAVQCHGA